MINTRKQQNISVNRSFSCCQIWANNAAIARYKCESDVALYRTPQLLI